MLGGLQLLRSHFVWRGGIDQNTKACEQMGRGRGYVSANVYT